MKCNGTFENCVNSRVGPEYYAALEQPNRRQNSETLVVASCL